jgi:DNA-binding FadR family transcriptional regulator
MARRAWFYFRRDSDLSEAAGRHVALAAAIASGDAAAAGAAADALVAHVRGGLKQAFADL